MTPLAAKRILQDPEFEVVERRGDRGERRAWVDGGAQRVGRKRDVIQTDTPPRTRAEAHVVVRLGMSYEVSKKLHRKASCHAVSFSPICIVALQ